MPFILFSGSKKVKVKCIYKSHLKTTHVDQSAVQLNHNKIERKIENRSKTIRSQSNRKSNRKTEAKPSHHLI